MQEQKVQQDKQQLQQKQNQMRAKASEDTKDDVDFIKKMAYDAQNMILDIEKRIQAKDAPSKRQDAIIIPLEPSNSSPNKGNKSANRAIVPQQ